MERDEYERDICARSQTAILVPFRPGMGINGWEPKVADCHRNVDHWVEHHLDHTVVRGWLAFATFYSDQVGYTAHSVVRAPDGELFDITPTVDPDCWRGCFIAHLGEEEMFFEMKKLGNEIRCQGKCPAAPLSPDLLC
ncbi:hypothetical protein [Roseibium aggregatum]|uniref:Uncharacterized protein n=1 Tax=Roseibium aggregatum TaxID=187304 RepID=A0A926P5V6_9HYPH|nr:hypothetical protein [Roseibium aggregatum]MBD1548681.1 hypothetical protein [Roseibium aggregatum]